MYLRARARADVCMCMCACRCEDVAVCVFSVVRVGVYASNYAS